MLNHYMHMEAYSDSFVDKQRRTIKGYEFKLLIIIPVTCLSFYIRIDFKLGSFIYCGPIV